MPLAIRPCGNRHKAGKAVLRPRQTHETRAAMPYPHYKNARKNPVDNPVENGVDKKELIHTPHGRPPPQVDIHRLINGDRAKIPHFCINKRYKLITFAPNVDNVDKRLSALKYNNKRK